MNRIREDLPEAAPIIARIDELVATMEARHASCGPDVRAVTHPIEFATSGEMEEMHLLKMQLRPKSAEEARADILKRRGISPKNPIH